MKKPGALRNSALFKSWDLQPASSAPCHGLGRSFPVFVVARLKLDAIEGDPPFSILDLGCGPGRDLRHFHSLEHEAVGLDGSKEFVAMARSFSGCEVLHQGFLTMTFPENRFDGVFANASLFHVPSQELPRVLLELSATLKVRGALSEENFLSRQIASHSVLG